VASHLKIDRNKTHRLLKFEEVFIRAACRLQHPKKVLNLELFDTN
jgi:hypothetical protein